MNLSQPSEVTGIDFDADSGRLALCNQAGLVQLYALDPSMGLSVLFSVVLENILPKAIAFGPKGSDRKVLVFSFEDGVV